MPIRSLLRRQKEGKGMGQLPVQHQLSETFSGGETPLPVHLQRLITSHCWRRTLLLLDPGGGSAGSLSGPALVLPWDCPPLWVTPSSGCCPFSSVAQATAASRARWRRTRNPSGSGAERMDNPTLSRSHRVRWAVGEHHWGSWAKTWKVTKASREPGFQQSSMLVFPLPPRQLR